MNLAALARITWTEARENFADIVARVRYNRECLLLTRHGKPVAMLTPVGVALPQLSEDVGVDQLEKLDGASGDL